MSLPKEPLISEKENKELNKVLDGITGPTKEEAANTVLNEQTVVEEVTDPKEIIPDNNTIDINKPDTEFEENFANYNTTLKEEKEPVRFAGVFKGITDVASDASPMYGFKTEKLVTETLELYKTAGASPRIGDVWKCENTGDFLCGFFVGEMVGSALSAFQVYHKREPSAEEHMEIVGLVEKHSDDIAAFFSKFNPK